MGLFNQRLLENVCIDRINSALSDADKINESQFAQKTTEQLTDEVCSRYKYTIPSLIEGSVETKSEDIQIDVSRDPQRMITSGPYYIKGVRKTLSVPFTGDSELFNYSLNMFGTSSMAGETRGNTVCIWLDLGPNHDVDIVANEYKKWLWEVKGCLNDLTQQIQEYREKLKAHVAAAVNRRKMWVDKNTNDDARLKELLGQ